MAWTTIRTLYDVAAQDFRVILGAGGAPDVAMPVTRAIAVRADASTSDTLLYKTVDSGTTWDEATTLMDLELPAASDATIVTGTLTMSTALHTVRGESGAADNLDTLAGLADSELAFLVAGAETITIRDTAVGAGNISTHGDTSMVLATGDMATVFRSGAVYHVSPLSQAAGMAAGNLALAQGSILAGNSSAQAAAVDLSAADAVPAGDGTDVVAMTLPTTGMVAKTGLNAAAGRTITGTADQVVVADGDGVAGNPTLSLPQSIDTDADVTFDSATIDEVRLTDTAASPATEGYLQYNADHIEYHDGTAARTLQDNADIGVTLQAYDADLDAVAALTGTGLVSRTGAATYAERTISNGTNGGLSVTDGDGVAGNPTLAVNLSDLAAAAVDVAADSVAILDATDGSTKAESIADLATAMAGAGLAAAAGVLTPDHDGLSGAAIDVAADSLAFIDATDASTKKEAIADLVTAMAGTGVTAAAGALSIGQAVATSDTPNFDGVTFGTSSELTISSGAITLTGGRHTVDTEADAASDFLDTINGLTAGGFYFLSPASNARDVVLRDASVGGGNVQTQNAGSITLAELADGVVIWSQDGSDAIVLCRRTLAPGVDRLSHEGNVAVAQLIVSGQPVATETITIGSDVYEWDGVGANINVTIAGTAEGSYDNLVTSVNGSGTESVVLDKISATEFRLRSADAPGGAKAAASPSIVLGETSSNVIWSCGNVNMNTLGGQAPVAVEFGSATIVITADMITGDLLRFAFPFDVATFTASVVNSSGVLQTGGNDTFAINNGDVLINFASGAGNDIQTSDVVTVFAYSG